MENTEIVQSILLEIRNTPLDLLNPGRQKSDPEFARLYKRARRVFGHWVKALEAAGIDPVKVYKRKPFVRVRNQTIQSLVREIQSIPLDECNSRAVQTHPERRRLYSLAQRLFPADGWSGALGAAGINPEKVRKKARLCSTEEILDYIRSRKASGLSIAPKDILKTTKGRRCYKGAVSATWRDSWDSYYIGWLGAVEEAGFDLEEEGIQAFYSNSRNT